MHVYGRTIPRLAGLTLAGALLATAASAEVTQQRLENAAAEPQNWLLTNGDYSNQRYSRLTQINRDTVGDLGVAFTVPIPTAMVGVTSAELENAPVVVDGMMYFNDEWGTTYKIDVTSGRTGKIVWVTDPAVAKDGAYLIKTTRGLSVYRDRVFVNLIDGRVVGINAETGEIEWDQQVTNKEEGWDYDVGETFTGVPLSAENRVMVGQSLGDVGTRGWLAALDYETGNELWRKYTVPGPGEPGHETWTDNHNAWRTGGGSLWQVGSYDPEQKVTIWGTANPVPMFDPEYRPGDNLFTNSAIAFNIEDGSMKWYFQYTPNESWDYDEIGIHFLYDRTVDGQTRKVVGHFARNGYFYQLDRTNGAYIGSTQYVNKITWTAGIDPKTGKPVEYDPNLDLQTYIPATRQRRADNQRIQVCPTIVGGVRWQPTAFNPETMVAWQASMDGCSTIMTGNSGAAEQGLIRADSLSPGEGAAKGEAMAEGGNPNGPGAVWLGGDYNVVGLEGAGPAVGLITGVDVNSGERIAFKHTPYNNLAGILATAGGLLFTGQVSGDVEAYSQDAALDLLWSFNTGIPIKAPPISYAIGDKQYIAILAGASGNADYPELSTMKSSAMLYVFGL